MRILPSKGQIKLDSNAKSTNKNLGLKNGETIRAKVIDIVANKVLIQLPNGKSLEADNQSNVNYTKNQSVDLKVIDIANGKVELSNVLGLQSDSKGDVSELLNKLSLESTPRNIEVAKLLIKNNIEPTEANFKSLKNSLIGFEKVIEHSSQQNQNMKVDSESLSKSISEFAKDVIKSNSTIVNTENELGSADKAASKAVLSRSGDQPANAGNEMTDGKGEGQKSSTVNHQLPGDKAQFTQEQKNLEVKTTDRPSSLETELKTLKDHVVDIKQQVKAELGPSDGGLKNASKELPKEDILSKTDGSVIAAKTASVDSKEIGSFSAKLSDIMNEINKSDITALKDSIGLVSKLDLEVNMINVITLDKLVNSNVFGKELMEFLTNLDTSDLNETELKLVNDLKETFDKLVKNEMSLDENIKDFKALQKSISNLKSLENVKTLDDKNVLQKNIIEKSPEVLNKINDILTYLPIPVDVNGQMKNMEIFVKRDEKNAKRINPDDTSILISLDTNTLGNVSSLIEVKKENLKITFILEEERVMELLSSNKKELEDRLEKVDKYNISLNFRLREAKEKLSGFDLIYKKDEFSVLDLKV